MTAAASERIRALNDAFRATGPVAGDWMITPSVQALGPIHVLEVVRQVQQFDRFEAGNDPYREHDFGSLEFAGETLFWKIDYYAHDLQHGSDDPAEPAITRRVLTIMLASES